MRILVPGGAGFIGSNFVHTLHHERPSWEVTVLDAMTYAANPATVAGFPTGTEVVAGSITDATLVDRLVRSHEVVVNFAAESHNDAALASPEPFVQTNVVGTFTLLEACRSHGARFHHVSTDEVFGDLPLGTPEAFTEATPLRPSSPYSATKAGGDVLVGAWARSFGVQATVSRCSNNFGPFQHVEKFIPRQITTLLDGGRPQVYGTGANVRDWIHVDDHNSAVLALLDQGVPGKAYLIGARCEKSNLDVVRTLLELFGLAPDFYDLVADRPGHDLRYAIDPSLLEGDTGWAPAHTDFHSALKETVDWYRDNEQWWRPTKAATEEFYRSRA
ncbi:ribose-phosphate pyrophosphokinase [Platysternon megacephalum]|uniref:Ribose-phosphate pyrophosphokinase n=1 Tax=Platysternon megacephalum TaxID=55544 RepID=A0A4D9DIW9_9SAUR|nr:ribose-phosphate pyrophosphokinase [Platysternon megacephalum]